MSETISAQGQSPALSAGAAARRLGVAVTTLRSWDRRYGLGPSQHQPGEHRRYGPADMARLESMCRLIAEGIPVAEAARTIVAGRTEPPTPAPEAPGGDRHRASAGGGNTLPIGRQGAMEARGLARCAMRLDAPQVLELLDAALAHDGVIAAWQHTIEPALRAVGRKWTETDGRYVEVEHLLSWCVNVALHRAHSPAPAPAWSRGRGVLLACAPDEWHSLPLEVLTAALTQRGTPVRMLGPAVPRAAVLEAARRTGPAHIVIWSHAARTADTATLAQLSKLPRTRVMAAGSGWAGRTPPGVTILHSAQQAVDACSPATTLGGQP